MQKREKILLFSFIGLIVLWQGQGLINSLVFEPVADRKSKIQRLEESISDKKIKERELELAVLWMKKASQRSLPPDPLIAASLYQNWLIDLSTKTRLNNISVTANRVDAKPIGNTYYVILATVKAQATLDQLCDFLYRFREAGLLQRVTRVSIEAPNHAGNPALNVSIFVEGLSLINSPAKDSPGGSRQTAGPRQAAQTPPGLCQNLRQERLRARLQRPPAPSQHGLDQDYPHARPAEPPFDSAAFVFLVAAFSNQDGLEAWLYDRTSNKQTVLTEKADFVVAGVTGHVLTIGSDFITLLVNGAEWRLELGENLSQMQKVNKPAPVGTP